MMEKGYVIKKRYISAEIIRITFDEKDVLTVSGTEKPLNEYELPLVTFD